MGAREEGDGAQVAAGSVMATQVEACPMCGCDVRGCSESVGDDQLRRWTQPVEHTEKADGARILLGGLVHIEGGPRCLRDAADR